MSSSHRRIASAALRVAFFLLLGKFAGAAKEMAVAWRYGVSAEVDAYQYTLTFATWLPVTLVGVLSVVLIPLLVRLNREGDGQRDGFLGQLNAAILLCGVLGGVLTWWLWPWVLDIFGRGLSPLTQGMTSELMLAFGPVVLLTLVAGVAAARLRAREHHVNNVLEGVPAMVILLWVLASPPNPGLGPLLWGTLLGTLIQAVWLHWLAARADGDWGHPRPGFSSHHWPELFRAVGIMLAGQIAMSFVSPLDQYAASYLGNNANATLGYATRLLSLVLGLGAVSVGRAALPVLSDLAAQGQWQRVRRLSMQWSFGMVVLGSALVLVGWWLAPWGVALVFERGAFTAEDTVRVAEAFRWGLLQLPFFFGVLMLVQLLASQQRYRLMAMIAFANFALKAALTLWLAPRMGLPGIFLATALMYLLSFVCYLLAALKPFNDGKPPAPEATTSGRAN